MPNTHEVPEIQNIYLYDDMVKPRQSRFPLVNFFRRKLNLDAEEVEEKRQAIMKKDGHYRVRYTGLNGYKRQYFHDLYISLIDLQWRYAFALFFNAYLIAFLVFGVIWWILAYNNGDFDNVNNPKWEPCISTVYSFPKCLLFSIETQTTIGYGVAYPNTDCDGALFMVFLQITIGILLDNILLGFIFVKFAQPKRRQKTIIFSKNACVTHHEGELALQVRVGDIRKSHLLAAEVHGVLVKRHVTAEGVNFPIYQKKVTFKSDGMGDTLVLMWPMILTHRIDETSPLWNVKPADLSNERYELIVFVEGTIETTGEFCQVRTSYNPKELLWGHRFDRIEEFDSGNGRWEIDFAAFNDVVYTSNIRHSAKELASFRNKKILVSENSDEDYDMSKVPIQTINMKTISYDVAPDLPSRDANGKRGISFRLPSNGSRDEDEDQIQDGRMAKGGSVASLDEKGYLTADEEEVTKMV